VEEKNLAGCLSSAQHWAAEHGGKGLTLQGVGGRLGFLQTLRTQVKPGQSAIQDLSGIVDVAVPHKRQLG
jgi:hypothetical protein